MVELAEIANFAGRVQLDVNRILRVRGFEQVENVQFVHATHQLVIALLATLTSGGQSLLDEDFDKFIVVVEVSEQFVHREVSA